MRALDKIRRLLHITADEVKRLGSYEEAQFELYDIMEETSLSKLDEEIEGGLKHAIAEYTKNYLTPAS